MDRSHCEADPKLRDIEQKVNAILLYAREREQRPIQIAEGPLGQVTATIDQALRRYRARQDSNHPILPQLGFEA